MEQHRDEGRNGRERTDGKCPTCKRDALNPQGVCLSCAYGLDRDLTVDAAQPSLPGLGQQPPGSPGR